MSEYQYYEFQAIDRLLTKDDQAALRAISSRARITGTSLTNSYQWGDFKGNPVKLMEGLFDLHLYLANWGSRRLMMRLPKVLVRRKQLSQGMGKVNSATIHETVDHLILDISQDEVEAEDFDNGSGWLAALAPLRADLLAGDQRVLYLIWLIGVQAEDLAEDDPEPLPGIGPMTGALEAFANFFGIDPDLLAAAAERQSEPLGPGSSSAAKKIIAAMSDTVKTDMLVRLFEGDPHIAAELRVKVKQARPGAPDIVRRGVGELLARAETIRRERSAIEARKSAEARRIEAEKLQRERRIRLEALARRGESVWRDVETEIERRSASGYDSAASLLSELRAVAESRGQLADFARRLAAIRDQHARKGMFIKRIAALK